MIFTTYWFLAFATVFFALYWLIRDARIRLALITLGSIVFQFHCAGTAGVLPIFILGIIVYFLGLLDSKRAHLIGIILCCLALLTYKYTGFIISTFVGFFNQELGNYMLEASKKMLPEVPPLGISFFVFEFVHYLMDRRHGCPPIKKPVDFVVFSVYFPSMVAGPIKRYEQFLPSLREGIAKVNSSDVMVGLIQVALGFSKKIIADNLTLWIERYEKSFTTESMTLRWLLFAGIGFRILLDFSGYSDIAIGIARMMGIRLPMNFNWPYLAKSIAEFWQRWHISLSSWIRDYIYIPLGGNRHGNARKIANGLIAFSLCGLWHGPAWNFVIWGVYHGLGLAVSNTYTQLPFGIGKGIETVFRRVPFLGWALTLLFVWLGWLLFFYPVDTAWKMAVALFVRHN